jgi:hypothetical protein
MGCIKKLWTFAAMVLPSVVKQLKCLGISSNAQKFSNEVEQISHLLGVHADRAIRVRVFEDQQSYFLVEFPSDFSTEAMIRQLGSVNLSIHPYLSCMMISSTFPETFLRMLQFYGYDLPKNLAEFTQEMISLANVNWSGSWNLTTSQEVVFSQGSCDDTVEYFSQQPFPTSRIQKHLDISMHEWPSLFF